MDLADDIQIKLFSVEEIRDFRKRLDTTETRINDHVKTSLLRNEVTLLETRTTIQADWDFGKLFSLRTGSNIESDSEEEEEIPAEAD